jgi:hypothetical protein
MSIFGKLDAAAVSTNPFWIEAGDYSAEVVDARYKTNRDNVKQLYIQYVITDENSEFLDQKPSHFFNLVDPDMTAEALALLPADEKKKIRMSMANLKKTLCGNEGNSNQKGLGVAIDDLNDENWNPETLKGTKVMIGIGNGGSSNEFVNIRWVNLAD